MIVAAIHPLVFGLLCGLAVACFAVVCRALMVRGADPWAVAWVSLVAGGLWIVPFVDLTGDIARAEWSVVTVVAFVAAQIAWAVTVFFDARAYSDLSASINALLSLFRLVLLVVVGIFAFGEAISVLGLLGVLGVVGGIGVGVERREIHAVRGARDRAIAVVAGATAISLDKFLTARLPLDLVLVAGFFLPALLLMVVRSDVLARARADVRRLPGLYLGAAVLNALAGWALVYGFAFGDLWTTSALRHAEVVFTFLLAVCFLGERERWVRRGVGAIICVGGAALVAAAHG